MLQFNQKVNALESAFITPRIIAVSKVKKNEKEIPGTLALSFGYIIKAIVDGNPAAFTDKTKTGAGAKLQSIVTALPADSVFNLYMPIKAEDRDSAELAKWQLTCTVKQADMIKACETLALADSIMSDATMRVNVASESAVATFGEYTVNQPVYFTEEGKAKRSSGKQAVTFTL